MTPLHQIEDACSQSLYRSRLRRLEEATRREDFIATVLTLAAVVLIVFLLAPR